MRIPNFFLFFGGYDRRNLDERDEIAKPAPISRLSDCHFDIGYLLPAEEAEGLALDSPKTLCLALDCTLEGFHSLVHIHVDAGRLSLHRIIDKNRILHIASSCNHEQRTCF